MRIALSILNIIITRCQWCEGNPLYVEYHDNEWGVPVFDAQKQFECLTLEIFQAGLSWITILKKRLPDDFDWIALGCAPDMYIAKWDQLCNTVFKEVV